MKRKEPTSTAGRGADARGDTGTGADTHRSKARDPAAAGDVGGIPSTVDAGMRERTGIARDPASPTPVERDAVQPKPERGEQPATGNRATGADSGAPTPDDEGPLESLGKAISEPVRGAPRSTPDKPRGG